MKYLILSIAILWTYSASAETVSGHVLQVKDNIAYVKTTNGKKIPVIMNDKTYYRKRKLIKNGKETYDFYVPLISRGDKITLTYDAEGADTKTGAVTASDILVNLDN